MSGLGRRSIIVTAVLSAVAASMLLTAFYDRVYRAEATLLLRDDLDVLDETVFLRSDSVRTNVAQRLGTDTLPPPADIQPHLGTQLIDIVVLSGDALTAVTLANAYAETYIELRGAAPDTSDTDSAIADLRASISGTHDAIATIDSDGELTAEDQVIRDLFVAQLAEQEARLAQLRADPASVGQAPGDDLVPAATVDEKATLPGSPERPRVVRTALLAGLAGLAIGLVASVVAARADDTLRRSADLSSIRRRIPIIGRIPHDPSLQRRPATRRRRIDDTSTTSIHALRDEVLFLGLDPPVRVIQVCAAALGAGATTVASELALALSEFSAVVLVDLDLRSPEIHHLIGVDDSMGVVDNLDAEPIDMTLYPVESNFDVITAGHPPKQPLGMLSRVRLNTFIDELCDRYDIVVLDTPDLESYGDATMISRLADAVIVVARIGHTPAGAVRSACRELERAGAPIMGFVVNNA